MVVGAGVGAVATGWWLSDTDRRRQVRRRTRYLRGRVRGWSYHVMGGHPAADVGDDVLVQRVRSELGRLTKALDVPHVHVNVIRRVVMLHGEVGTDEEADAIELVAHRVEGVDGVLSYLHVGLRPGATRPSEGAAVYTASPALRRLVAAAEDAGVPRSVAPAAVRAVVATFIERLPDAAREHLLGHLPRDVQVLATPPRRHGSVEHVRRFDDFVDAVLEADHVDPTTAGEVTVAVVGALRLLVPEEAGHVTAVLPAELRRLWLSPPA